MRRLPAVLILAAVTLTAACTVDRPSATPTDKRPATDTSTAEPSVSSRRIQVTWAATREQWRREGPVFQRLLRSVRLVRTNSG